MKYIDDEYDDIYDASIFFILKNSDFVYNQEFNPSDKDMVQFIMLTNDALNSDYGEDNTICISRNWYHFSKGKHIISELEQGLYNSRWYKYRIPQKGDLPEFVWQTDESMITYDNRLIIDASTCLCTNNFKELQDIYIDFDGLNHSKEIMINATYTINKYNKQGDKITLEQYIPAFMVTYKAIEDFNGEKIHGFMPSIGQMLVINKNITELNNVIRMHTSDIYQLFDTTYKDFSYNQDEKLFMNFMTSTERDNLYYWEFSCGNIQTSNKLIKNPIISLFSIK